MRYVESYIHHHRIGVLVELDTPDEITLRCREFKVLASELAVHIAASNLPDTDAPNETLLKQGWIKDPDIEVGEAIDRVSRLLKTPIRITRFVRYGVDDRQFGVTYGVGICTATLKARNYRSLALLQRLGFERDRCDNFEEIVMSKRIDSPLN